MDWTPGCSDEDLVRQAVRHARDRDKQKGERHPRWMAVMSIFAVGSGYARGLCMRFDLDPDEMVQS